MLIIKTLKKLFTLFLFVAIFASSTLKAVELVIGEETIKPGIVFIFEGAVKDTILPASRHLKEKNTDVHIEARVNWDTENIPEGTPAGGFVPYLMITAKVENEKTGLSTFIDLVPHINLIDNFHYARNIVLPGDTADKYSVEFKVTPPALTEVGLHKDWTKKYGKRIMKGATFKYEGVDFEEIAKATR